ncbi:hypothetical protein B0H13DRAFT_2372121 [Mycena leptocephala]|nr:hypothetical protein B0H13DRAFT_2372121 [Mycena leptocephala]
MHMRATTLRLQTRTWRVCRCIAAACARSALARPGMRDALKTRVHRIASHAHVRAPQLALVITHILPTADLGLGTPPHCASQPRSREGRGAHRMQPPTLEMRGIPAVVRCGARWAFDVGYGDLGGGMRGSRGRERNETKVAYLIHGHVVAVYRRDGVQIWEEDEQEAREGGRSAGRNRVVWGKADLGVPHAENSARGHGEIRRRGGRGRRDKK